MWMWRAMDCLIFVLEIKQQYFHLKQSIMAFSPDLTSFACGLTADVNYRLQAKIIGYTTIGSAEFENVDTNEFKVHGSYNVLGHQGSFDLSLVVTGDGAGSINLNGSSYPCTFTTSGSNLFVHFNEGTKAISVEMACWDNGLWISGDVPYNLWIGK